MRGACAALTRLGFGEDLGDLVEIVLTAEGADVGLGFKATCLLFEGRLRDVGEVGAEFGENMVADLDAVGTRDCFAPIGV